jgi:long-chain acyl-CoA synthetase
MDMSERIWLKNYPPGVPPEIDPAQYESLTAMMVESMHKFAGQVAYRCMGADLRYGELDRRSAAVGAWLQAQGVQPGDRVAIMLPNVLQFPIAFFGALRAGATVVNVNPLYTPHELEFQLKDSGAQTLFVLENFAHTVQAVWDRVPTRRVVICAMGDMFPGPKGWLVNAVVRHVKKLVRPYSLPEQNVVRFPQVIAQGARLTLRPVSARPGEVAVLQYTGGTTGVAKGAMLLHRNLVANVLQAEACYQPALRRIRNATQFTMVTALPLYHIYALTCCALLGMRGGAMCILIPNPRDFASVVKALQGEKIHIIPAVNTLFNALANYPPFARLDFSHLVLSCGGGMAVQRAVADRWQKLTGSPICEGYGLSETSPLVCCNRTDTDAYSGTIGLPAPSTELAILDDDGVPMPVGSVGEIGVRGPQVMAGYWQRPDETAKVMTAEGYLRTGDIGVMDEKGYTRIVDRKKDMILVSGFNVYPNEVEDVVAAIPGVLECAAIGVPNEHSGEAVKIFVVRKDPGLTEKDILAFCHENLAGYKRPKYVEFRVDLPKSSVGKILRRQLRPS